MRKRTMKIITIICCITYVLPDWQAWNILFGVFTTTSLQQYMIQQKKSQQTLAPQIGQGFTLNKFVGYLALHKHESL